MNLEEKHYQDKASAELEAFEWFKRRKQNENIRVDYTSMEDKYSAFDVWLYSGATELITEIKVRKDITGEKMDQYGGAFFEMTKLSRIDEYKTKRGIDNKVLYFNFLKDELRVYEVSMDPSMYTWEIKKLPKNNFDKTKIWKTVTKLTNRELIEVIKYKK